MKARPSVQGRTGGSAVRTAKKPNAGHGPDDRRIFELQAEVCKTLANPKRLEIIHALREGEKTVSDLVDILGVPKANVSQHLAVMRTTGVLKNRRDGVNIHYSLSSPKVTEACMLMKEVLTERLLHKSGLLKNLSG